MSLITLAPPEVTFDAASHTYRHKGTRVPGVTSIIGALHSFAGVSREIMLAAQLRGTAAHVATQFDDEMDLDETGLSADTAGRLAGWRAFRSDYQAEWTAIECMLFSRKYRFAGQSDRFGHLRRPGFEGFWCVDVKTAKQSHPVWGVQTAAYGLAAEPAEKLRRATVQIQADGTYTFTEWADPSDQAVFLSCLTLGSFATKHNLHIARP